MGTSGKSGRADARRGAAGTGLSRKRQRDYLEEIDRLMVPPGRRVSLARDFDPDYTAGFLDKHSAREALRRGRELLAEQAARLYAQDTWSLLVVLQAMDAAGKDGTIKHVMSGVNPQGCQVFSFKAPSAEELDHDYLWRAARALPERGRIGIFNRSYYEEVLVARVHPEVLARQKLPPSARGKDVWKRRFRQINAFERHLVENGTLVLKFFLHLGREEQRQRFLERIERPEKNWKFSAADVRERAFWDDYMAAYEDAFRHTSTPWAPWYVVPANHKWYSRIAVCATIVRRLAELDLRWPQVSAEHRAGLAEAGRLLRAEDA